MARATTVARAEWHGIRLMNTSVPPSQLPHKLDSTGLITIRSRLPELHTGIASGPVRITVDALTSAPTEIEVEWDDIGEVSLDVNTGPIVLVGPMETLSPDAPRLDAHGPGTYRLRIHGRNRDQDYDLAVSETQEEYLILCWKAPAAASVTHSSTSSTSSSWITSHTHAVGQPRPDYAAAVTTGSSPRRPNTRENLLRHNQ